MLLRVEEASLGIAARCLPARDEGAGWLVEPTADLGIEAETGQPALYVATLSLSRPIWSSVSWVASSATTAGSTDANKSRSSVLGPALATSALTRNPKIDNAIMKTRNGLFFPDLEVSVVSSL